MLPQSLVIRADASAEIGNGHVMRCLALAQSARDNGYPTTYLSHYTLPDALQKRLQAEGVEVILINEKQGSMQDAKQTIHYCQSLRPASLILDGYHFNSDYQAHIQQAHIPLLIIDDNGHLKNYHADWILNQNIHANASLYPNNNQAKLLLGLQYALIRKEFWQWRGQQCNISEDVTNLLITMGGSDPNNVTLSVLKALSSVPSINNMAIRVIVGGSNPHRHSLERYVASHNLNIELLYDVTDMPALMAWADLAISAGGSTIWELCLMGVPTIVIVTADNQVGLAHELHAQQIIKLLGWFNKIDLLQIASLTSDLIDGYEERANMSHKGQSLVDGYGVDRIICEII